MKIGFIGTGKLGGPLAAVFAYVHDVIAYDQDAAALNRLCEPVLSAWSHEEALPELLLDVKVKSAVDIAEVCRESELVFVVVQTPHAPHLDGSQPTNGDVADFDYTALQGAVRGIARATEGRPSPLLVAVVSTVLPGTTNRLLRPLQHPGFRLVYTPAFVAMGSVVADFRVPEFTLVGTDGEVDLEPLARAFASVQEDTDGPIITTSVESAELAKVAYNTFIGLKVAFANMLMEVCEGTGADVDDVSGVLAAATHRIASPAYLQAGMGDGGPCHPRDNLALSWLINRIGVSVNLPDWTMRAREIQTRWMVSYIHHHHMRTGLPVFVLGRSYKAGSPLLQGSSALLLIGMLEEYGLLHAAHDPLVDVGFKADETTPRIGQERPHLFVIATPHDEVLSWPFPMGSVVIDPWSAILPHEVQDGVEVLRPGRKR